MMVDSWLAPPVVFGVVLSRFKKNIWEVILEIEAPCNSYYFQGLTESWNMSIYFDKGVVAVKAFQLENKKQSWEKACGNIQHAYIHDAPRFVHFNDHSRKVTIRPQDKEDRGAHKILIEVWIKSTKSFHALFILVKLPISYIDSDLKPYFWPALSDEIK